MRIHNLLRAVVVLACWLGNMAAAQASHLLGAELAYDYAGTPAAPHRYHVTARLSTDATNGGPTAIPNSIALNCNATGCTNGAGSFVATLPLSSFQRQFTGCNNSGLLYYLVVLDGLVDLPPAQWKLSIDLMTRVLGIYNVQQSSATSIYVSTELNNSSGLVNFSPRFTTSHLIYLTSGQPQRYSLSAFDPDGDSLTYQLVQPLGGSRAPLPCELPTVGALAPHFLLDRFTGELRTSGSSQRGVFALAVQVAEYRRLGGSWQLIGNVLRDLAYYSTSATNHRVPDFTGVAPTGNPGRQLLGQPIPATAGQLLDLTLTAIDSTASLALTLSSDAVGIVPGLAFRNLGNGQGQLLWQVPATLSPGRYTFTATVFDNGCPVLGHSVLTLTFVVAQPLGTAAARQALLQPPYPTPFVEEVRFQLTSVGPQAVTITDATGRVVAQLRSAPDGRVRWQPAASVAGGLYFARSSDGRQVARLAYAGH